MYQYKLLGVDASFSTRLQMRQSRSARVCMVHILKGPRNRQLFISAGIFNRFWWLETKDCDSYDISFEYMQYALRELTFRKCCKALSISSLVYACLCTFLNHSAEWVPLIINLQLIKLSAQHVLYSLCLWGKRRRYSFVYRGENPPMLSKNHCFSSLLLPCET